MYWQENLSVASFALLALLLITSPAERDEDTNEQEENMLGGSAMVRHSGTMLAEIQKTDMQSEQKDGYQGKDSKKDTEAYQTSPAQAVIADTLAKQKKYAYQGAVANKGYMTCRYLDDFVHNKLFGHPLRSSKGPYYVFVPKQPSGSPEVLICPTLTEDGGSNMNVEYLRKLVPQLDEEGEFTSGKKYGNKAEVIDTSKLRDDILCELVKFEPGKQKIQCSGIKKINAPESMLRDQARPVEAKLSEYKEKGLDYYGKSYFSGEHVIKVLCEEKMESACVSKWEANRGRGGKDFVDTVTYAVLGLGPSRFGLSTWLGRKRGECMSNHLGYLHCLNREISCDASAPLTKEALLWVANMAGMTPQKFADLTSDEQRLATSHANKVTGASYRRCGKDIKRTPERTYKDKALLYSKGPWNLCWGELWCSPFVGMNNDCTKEKYADDSRKAQWAHMLGPTPNDQGGIVTLPGGATLDPEMIKPSGPKSCLKNPAYEYHSESIDTKYLVEHGLAE